MHEKNNNKKPLRQMRTSSWFTFALHENWYLQTKRTAMAFCSVYHLFNTPRPECVCVLGFGDSA